MKTALGICGIIVLAAGTAQAGRAVLGVNGHAAGVITSVFQALQALNQHGDNIAGRYRADDATHTQTPNFEMFEC